MRLYGCGLAGPGYVLAGHAPRREAFYTEVLAMKADAPAVDDLLALCAAAAEAEQSALEEGADASSPAGRDSKASAAEIGSEVSGNAHPLQAQASPEVGAAVRLMNVAARALTALDGHPITRQEFRKRLHKHFLEQAFHRMKADAGTSSGHPTLWVGWCKRTMQNIASLDVSCLRLVEAALKIKSVHIVPQYSRGGFSLAPASAARIAAYATTLREHQACLRVVALALARARSGCRDEHVRAASPDQVMLEKVLRFHDDCLVDVISDLKWTEREIGFLPSRNLVTPTIRFGNVRARAPRTFYTGH